ncbi:MAG: hypothetical protein PHH83_04285 [Patescibacteria group bacterium]|nr:hypothetical protein [Patescibacteria group bacterium]
MKNKIAIIILIVVVIAGVAVIGFYFNKQNKQPTGFIENTTLPNQTKTNKQTNNEQSQNKLVTNDFEINLPTGWQKTTPPVGTSVMAVKADEQFKDPAAQKINFRSYFAVSYDTTQGKNLSEYIQTVKNQLQQTIPGVVFAQEHDTTINGKVARAFEADLNQRGVNFKMLMVAIKGSGDDVWVISFSTLQSIWAEYQKTFSDIAGNFKLKLKN